MPYLHDESQDVARALDAQVTPHLFVLDAEQHARWTAARPTQDPGDEDEEHDAEWLREALDAVLAGCKPAIERAPARAAARSSGSASARPHG